MLVCRVGIVAAFVGVSLAAQFPPHVELGELQPPNGTRLENIDQLGAAAALDLDGDGLDDFVLATPNASHGFGSAGSVYVLWGPLSETYGLDPELAYPTSGLRLDGLGSGDHLGRGVGRAGDLNGDGYQDLAMNSFTRSFVIFGGPHLRSSTSIDLAALDGTLGFQMHTAVPEADTQVFAPLHDVNGDGDDDLFVGLPNKPTPWTTISLQNDVRDVAAGDLDGDGDLDLVAAEGDRNTLAVLFNAGDGAFPVRTSLNLNVNRGVHLLDLDGDGDLDLVAEWDKYLSGTIVEGWLAVFLNQGSGSFAPRQDYQVGTHGTGIKAALGDLDGDGDPDLAGINYEADMSPAPTLTDIRIWLNDGTGHFVQGESRSAAIIARDVVILDLNADGKPDLAISTDTRSPTSRVFLFANDGSAHFTPAGSLQLGFYTPSMAVGDLTGDGRDDLLCFTLLFVNSAAGLQAGQFIVYPRTSDGASALADMDGDGTLDLVLDDQADGFQVHENPGDGLFDRHYQYNYNSVRGKPKVADLDGDGDGDVIVQSRNKLSLAFNRGDGSFGGNGSGGAFVVFGSATLGSGGSLDLDALGGSGGFSILGADSRSNLGLSASAAGDMNGDGLGDLAFSAPFTGGDHGSLYVVYGALGLGSGGVLDPRALTPTTGLAIHGPRPEGFCRSVLGDLDVNGDGAPDLACGGPNAVIDGQTEAGRVCVVFGSPALTAAGTIDLDALDGTNGYTITGEQGTYLGDGAVTLGDLNGDGKDDFAMGATADDWHGVDRGGVYVLFGDPVTSGGTLSIHDLHGRYGMALHPRFNHGFVGHQLASGDWNDDGKPDLYIASRAFFPGNPEPGSVHLVWGYDLPHFRRH